MGVEGEPSLVVHLDPARWQGVGLLLGLDSRSQPCLLVGELIKVGLFLFDGRWMAVQTIVGGIGLPEAVEAVPTHPTPIDVARRILSGCKGVGRLLFHRHHLLPLLPPLFLHPLTLQDCVV